MSKYGFEKNSVDKNTINEQVNKLDIKSTNESINVTSKLVDGVNNFELEFMGTGGDLSGLVRDIKSPDTNVIFEETVNPDGTKDINMITDNLTNEDLTNSLNEYYTKAETDIALELKANLSDVYDKTESDANYPNKNSFTNLSARVSNVEASKANVTDVYNKIEVDNALSTKANNTDVYTKAQSDSQFALKTNLTNLTNRVSNVELNKVDDIVGTNITTTKKVVGNKVTYDLIGTKQRVLNFADLGITDADFTNLPNSPSTTDSWNRHYSLKDCLLKILTKNITLFDKNTILVESFRADNGFPELCKYFGQYLEHTNLKNLNTTFRTYSLQITTNNFFVSNGIDKSLRGDIFGSWTGDIFTPTGINVYQNQDGLREEDILYNDNSSNDSSVINNFISGVIHVAGDKPKSIKIGRDINTNLYKSLCRLFNLPLTYNLGFLFEIKKPSDHSDLITYTIYAKDNVNKKLDFIYISTIEAKKPVNISKIGFVKYIKTISDTSVPNNSNYLLSDNMSIANNIENYVLGGKVGGIWGFNYPINVDGLMFVNHNRYVRLDIRVGLKINVGNHQDLKIRIKRGDGTYVDNNIGIVNTSNDITETTTLMSTYSTNANDPFVSQGFALELSNTSGDQITLPAQTVQINVGLTYY